jgi:SAM-dependent methyltransferase
MEPERLRTRFLWNKDVIVSVSNDRFVVNTTSSDRRLETNDATFLEFLRAFAKPKSLSELLSEIVDAAAETEHAYLSEERVNGIMSMAIAAVEDLYSIGALMVADNPSARRRDCAAADQPDRSCHDLILSLVSAINWTAGASVALDPTFNGGAHHEAVRQVLGSCIVDLGRLSGQLQRLQGPYIASQLATLGIPKRARHLKLHLGCGTYRLATWINIDAYPAELAIDLRWGLPFHEASADYVFYCHGLEHLIYPTEAKAVLSDIRRVLSNDGVLRVVVPDIEQCLKAYAQDTDSFFESRKDTWTWWPEWKTRLEPTLFYAGVNAYPGLTSHKFGYDYETLRVLLEDSGFSNVQKSSYMGSTYPVLQVDNCSRVAGARHGEGHYSLFVEAVK